MRCARVRELLTASGGSHPLDSVVGQELFPHLDDCSHCRSLAIEIDPTFVFRSLAPVSVSESEIVRMRDSVHTLIRNQGLEERVSDRHRGLRRAAVGFLAVLALILGPEMSPFERGLPATGIRRVSGTLAATQLSAPYPSIEEVYPSSARVYQLQDKGLSIVMIVDESLDL